MEHLSLLAGGQEHSIADWEREAAAVLRKSGRITEDQPDSLIWEKLTRATLDGIAIRPLGTADDAPEPVVRPARTGAWDIRALVSDADAAAANRIALDDLEGGATSVWLAGAAATGVGRALEGVFIDLAPIVLDAPQQPLAAAQALVAEAEARGVTLHPDTNLGADPLGHHIRRRGSSGDLGEIVDIARLARDNGVLGVVVDATAVHDRGATDVQELGYSIALGTAYLRVLAEAGFEVTDAAELVEFRYAATDEQFVTIAKLRAARRLWASVLARSGVTGVEQRQHAVTSRPMLSRYDPDVNMLRGTVAAFAAGVGGANSVTVLPYDSANGRPEAFGRRIARNISHLLVDEAHVAVVTDPAGGSYFVERLTADLTDAAWAEFQRIESEGFDSLSPRVEEAAAARDALVATRKRPITGLTEFPNLDETLPQRDPDPANDGVRFYGASFEALRDDPPAEHVFLATLGTVAEHTARATFVSNLFAAGGIHVDSAGVTTDPESLVEAYAGQPVACLAGTDAAYAEWGAAAARALREAGVRHLIVAGKSTDYTDDSAALGIDALAFLNRTREQLS
ncbi:MAG: methylmalonyl-CoA mutase family protein [Nocardioidaceae bacterium]